MDVDVSSIFGECVRLILQLDDHCRNILIRN